MKQSFSHGRTKSVVVETKRKRVVVPPKPGAPGAARLAGTATHLGDPSKRPAGISDAEMERRLAALRNAKAREAEDAAKRADDDRVREEERQRKRDEIEAKEREERERDAARAPEGRRRSPRQGRRRSRGASRAERGPAAPRRSRARPAGAADACGTRAAVR